MTTFGNLVPVLLVVAVVALGFGIQVVLLRPRSLTAAGAVVLDVGGSVRRWFARHPVALPVAVGLVLRLVWVLVVAETPPPDGNDAAEYLRMTERFLDGDAPNFVSGEPSAFWAPGYPALLLPFVAVANIMGGPSPALVAALVNALAGAATVAAAAWLADRWIGPSARVPTAWLMAVAPAHIYFTATAHAETVFTALFLLVAVTATRMVDRSEGRPLPTRALVILGLAIGITVLVRSPGLALLVAPALMLRGVRGHWDGAWRALLATTAGAAVVLVPWTVFNGVYIGVWSPLSTQNATVLCVGHHDDATGGFPSEMSPEMQRDCYTNSPYVHPSLGNVEPDEGFGEPDEARWYQQASRRGIGWALTHPVEEIGLLHQRFVRSWGTDWDALPAAKNYTDDDWAGSATGPLNAVANGWLWLVEGLTVLGLLLVPACRRAWPLWTLGAVVAAAPLAGLAQPHFRHPAIPFMAIIAGGAIGWFLDRRGTAEPHSAGSDTSATFAGA